MSKDKNSNPKLAKSEAISREQSSRRSQAPAWRSRIWLIISFFVLTIGGSYAYLNLISISGIKTYGFKVVAKYPHDSAAFTEGLLYHDGHVYESTGLEGQSTLRKIDLQSSQVIIEKLEAKIFGEGLALWRDRLIQLTYNTGIAYVYDLDLKRQEKTFEYDGQGWGLTHDGRYLIMSNGSSELQFRDPETFKLGHRLVVTEKGRRKGRLNELEFVDGKIYANVWHEDYLLEIDPRTGNVLARIDLAGLLPYKERPNNREAVLNGIAYNTDTGRFIVTGKYWPFLYEIELVSREPK